MLVSAGQDSTQKEKRILFILYIHVNWNQLRKRNSCRSAGITRVAAVNS